jgi:hypothetical protein
MRTNETIELLQMAWDALDTASGELYEAMTILSRITDIDDIKKDFERIDISLIESVKSQIEELIEKKRK